MLCTTPDDRRTLLQMPRKELARHQLARLNELFQEVVPRNRFYAEKFARVDVSLPLNSLSQLEQFPFTFKEELATAAGGNDLSANLTYPLEHYVRYHQTSGTRGRPMAVLDTADDWQWWIECWQFILDAADFKMRQAALALAPAEEHAIQGGEQPGLGPGRVAQLSALGQQPAISFLRQFAGVVLVARKTVTKGVQRLIMSRHRLLVIHFIHPN